MRAESRVRTGMVGSAVKQSDHADRKLERAEREIAKLHAKLVQQQLENGELRSGLKHMDGVVADLRQAKAEIAALNGEVRELTRANREHARRHEMLQAEIVKTRDRNRNVALSKSRSPNVIPQLWQRDV